MNKEEGNQEQEKKPKKKENKRIDYTNATSIFQSSPDRLKYFQRTNKFIQYGIGLLIRAELYKRGLTVRGLALLLQEQGFKVNSSTLTSFLQGSSNRWSLGQLYFSAYVLGVDLDFRKIEEAREYLRDNGRSVKDF